MTNIRQSVFETNSSSTHAIALSTGELSFDNRYSLTSDGFVQIVPEEFGWEFEEYNDVGTKLSYLYIYIRDWVSSHNNRQAKYFELLNEAVKQATSAKGFVWMGNDDEFNSGYIDHQAVEDSNFDGLFKTVGKLKNFLFNKKSRLYTGNDNSSQDLGAPSGISYV